MKSRNSNSRKRRTIRQRLNQSTKRSRTKKAAQGSARSTRQLSPSQQNERIRCLAALNRCRRGESRSLSAAARAERTTVKAIRTLVPAAISQARPGGRIRGKVTDTQFTHGAI